MRKYLFIAAAFQVSAISTASASDEANIAGTWAGTFMCDSGEGLLVLNVNDAGGMTEGDMEAYNFRDPCRSGSGPCNDLYRDMFLSSRKLSGRLDFYPTVSNPSFAAESITVKGRASILEEGFKLQTDAYWGRDYTPAYAEDISGLYISDVTDGHLRGRLLSSACYQASLYRISD